MKTIIFICLISILGCSHFPLHTNSQYNEEMSKMAAEIAFLNSQIKIKNTELAVKDKKLQRVKKIKEDIEKQFQNEIKNNQIAVSMRGTKIIISINNNILFDTAKTKIKEQSKVSLEKIIKILNDYYSKNMIEVEGNTDNVPIYNKNFLSNWELSTGRAHSVRQYLINKGIKPNQIIVSGRSKYNPVDSNHTEKGKSLNRRVDIIIVPNEE